MTISFVPSEVEDHMGLADGIMRTQDMKGEGLWLPEQEGVRQLDGCVGPVLANHKV